MKIVFIVISLFLFIKTSIPQVTSLGKSVKEISEYIASDEFHSLSNTVNDLAMVDTIYLKSLNFLNNDYSEALLGLTFACIPYSEVPIKIPLVGIAFKVPLVCAVDSIFQLKNKNLPSNLLFDSPKTDLGDKDKLAHFFGSAFLSYNSKIFDFTKIIGIFIEDFEENFYVQASVDLRDITADDLGNIFGKLLKQNKNLLPSQVLSIYPLTFLRYNL